MSLFINPHIDNYRNRITANLGGVILLNLAEFTAWYNPPQPKQSVRTYEKARDEEKQNLIIKRQNSIELAKKKSSKILLELVDGVCLNADGSPAIGQQYGMSAINHATSNAEFDLLVAVDSAYLDVKGTVTTNTLSKHKLAHVVGFIIAERGECKLQKHRNTYSVNLICVKPITLTKNKQTIKGNLLLGAYLYCIKNSVFNQYGILELAGGYTNTAGFISYTKMGFDKDASLFGINCFGDSNNLPMSVNLANVTAENIIERATDRVPRVVTATEDDSGIFANRNNKNINLKTLGIYNNLRFKVELHINDPSEPVEPIHEPPNREEMLIWREIIDDIEKNDVEIINNDPRSIDMNEVKRKIEGRIGYILSNSPAVSSLNSSNSCVECDDEQDTSIWGLITRCCPRKKTKKLGGKKIKRRKSRKNNKK